MALAEVQDENAPVQNTKALFERQDSLCAAAIKANTRSAELALKRIQVHESRFGPTDEKVEKLWRDVREIICL
jgi:hypothetical protein